MKVLPLVIASILNRQKVQATSIFNIKIPIYFELFETSTRLSRYIAIRYPEELRMKKAVIALSMAVLATCTLSINADAKKKKSPKLLSGAVAQQNIVKVNKGITWHTSLNRALHDAHRQGKMVLWVQMIGKMDGAT